MQILKLDWLFLRFVDQHHQNKYTNDDHVSLLVIAHQTSRAANIWNTSLEIEMRCQTKRTRNYIYRPISVLVADTNIRLALATNPLPRVCVLSSGVFVVSSIQTVGAGESSLPSGAHRDCTHTRLRLVGNRRWISIESGWLVLAKSVAMARIR